MVNIVTKAIVLCVFQVVYGDYQCLCNYNVELPVYSKDTSLSQVVGYMYEFDCKAIYAKGVKDAKFVQVQFENKVGYIENADGIQVQICQGSVPFEDQVTTTTIMTTQSLAASTKTTSGVPRTTEAITAKLSTEQSTPSTTKTNVVISINVDRNHTINNGNTNHSTGNTPAISSSTFQPSSVPTSSSVSLLHNVTLSFQTHLNKTLYTVNSSSTSTNIPTSSSSSLSSKTTQSSALLTRLTTLKSTPPTTVSTTRSTTTTTTTSSTTTTTVATTAITTPKPSCANGWIIYKSSCYMFQTNHRLHWDDANNDCAGRSSHLAIVETADEFNFLKQQLDQRIDTHDDDDPSTSAWVAGRDNRQEGHWEWYDGFTNTYKPFTYKHWGDDEPDAGDHEHEEDCMTMVGNEGFRWADYSCHEDMYHVCEKSAIGHVQAVTQAPPKQTNTADCPQGWVTYQGSCYLFHTNDRKKWKDANSFCVSQQAHLAIIETAEEDHFLKQQSSHRIREDDDDSDSGVWIAGSDDDNEGHWEWIDDYSHTHTLIQGYSNWHPGEPDSGDGEHGEDCMCMIGVKNYEWQDYRCHTHMFFICEKSRVLAAPLVG